MIANKMLRNKLNSMSFDINTDDLIPIYEKRSKVKPKDDRIQKSTKKTRFVDKRSYFSEESYN